MMCHPVSTAVGPAGQLLRPRVSRPRPTGLTVRLICPRPTRPRPTRPHARTGLTVHLNTTWITAAAGVVILIVSMALMAYSAPGRAPATVRPHPASHASAHLQREPGPGPVPGPGRYRGSELRPSR